MPNKDLDDDCSLQKMIDHVLVVTSVKQASSVFLKPTIT